MIFPPNWTGSLQFDAESIEIHPFRSGSHSSIYYDFHCSKIQQGRSQGYRLQGTFHPKQVIELQAFYITIPFTFQAHHRFLLNGFQSWSHSREVFSGQKMPRLRRIAKPYFQYYGDEYIDLVKRTRPNKYSWSYGYARIGEKELAFAGSLNEQFAYTLIEYDLAQSCFRIHFDVEHLRLQHSLPLFDFLFLEGPEAEVRSIFQSLQAQNPRPAPSLWVWNSWYHFYRDISPAKLRQALSGVANSALQAKVFQIDDGYQSAVGDWLRPNPAFDQQMPKLARKIKEAGLQPGLWLAPMAVDQQSNILAQNPDWILKDAQGKRLKVGYNPMWGGWYYGLDFYQPGVQQYLTQVFQTVTKKWGYEFLKLDFLFAACLAPPPYKTRAQVMSEVLEFIRSLCPNTTLLGCGVPLASVAGRLDYCRVGPDTHLSWDHSLLRFLRKRERVSTQLALETILGRWWLNGLWFGSDPDVFILREKGHQLSPEVQRTLLLVTAIFGQLHSTSDLPDAYDASTQGELAEARFWSQGQVEQVQWLSSDLFRVTFSLDHRHWRLLINWSQKTQSWPELPTLVLDPGESIILAEEKRS